MSFSSRLDRTMSNKTPQKDDVSRRFALKIIAGSASAAVSFPVLNHAKPVKAPYRAHSARAAADFEPKFFNDQQIQTLAVLSEAVIPADEHSPGAKAARVYEYMDTSIGESEPRTKEFWKQGLAAIDKAAELEHDVRFTECTSEQQTALLKKISEDEDHAATLEERFFVAVKRATIDGYYTSEIGIHKELEYQGNTALADFPGCVHESHKRE